MRIIRIRKIQPAFHPDSHQSILESDEAFFIVIRKSLHPRQTIYSISNLKNSQQQFSPKNLNVPEEYSIDLLTNVKYATSDTTILLQPYQTLWLSFNKI